MKTSLFLFMLIAILSFSFSQEKDCNSTNIEEVAPCLPGMTLNAAVLKLNLNSSQYSVIEMPHGILQGFQIDIPGYEIELKIIPIPVVLTPVIGTREQYIGEERIISAYWYSKVKHTSKILYK